ncbi:MAG: PAS domain S-box protein, partial [Acidobacteria bacterium]|nr:PAS domain S-box protein [Acidobacteriota bacterium]
EEQLIRMADSIPSMICYIDREKKYRFTNAAYRDWFGIDKDQILGLSIEDVLGPEQYGSIRARVEQAMSGSRVTYNKEIPDKKGNARHFQVNYLPQRGDNGKVLGFYTLLHDLTEQKNSEQKLQESEARYRALVEYSPTAICVVDAETGRFVDCNRQAVMLFGIDRDTLLTLGPREISPPFQPCGRPSEEVARERLSEAIRDGHGVFEWVHRNAEGLDIPCEVRLAPFPAKGRHLFRGDIVDISDRKRAEEEKRKNEKRLQLLLETARAIPWEVDASTYNFIYVGPQAVKLLGYPLEKWREADFWVSHIHPEDRDSALQFCKVSSKRLHEFDFEYRMISSSGKVVWVHDLVSVEFENGSPRRLRGFLIDITARKQADLLQAGQKRVLEMLAGGEPLDAVLNELARTVDNQQTGMRCSILLVDEGGKHLRHSAGPGLPDEYNKAIDGLEIGEKSGSCGRAAFRGERVIVADTLNDPLFAPFRELAVRFGLGACWSQPIVSTHGEVLGTFAVYHDKPHHPTDYELAMVEQVAYLAGVAIERTSAQQALKKNEEALRLSQRVLQSLAGKLLTAQEEERRRLARELHDDLAQRLAALAIEAGKLEQDVSHPPGEIARKLREMKNRIVRISEDVHGISRQLHPSIIEDLGLSDAIASECQNFSEREGIQIDFAPGGVLDGLPKEISLCLYRVVQEGLRNVAKHSRAKEARVSARRENGTLRLSIRDTGIGFDPARPKGRAGLGLDSMKERVRLIQGALSIVTGEGKGTTIEVRVPLIGGQK